MAAVHLCSEVLTRLTFMIQGRWFLSSDAGYVSTLTATHLIRFCALVGGIGAGKPLLSLAPWGPLHLLMAPVFGS